MPPQCLSHSARFWVFLASAAFSAAVVIFSGVQLVRSADPGRESVYLAALTGTAALWIPSPAPSRQSRRAQPRGVDMQSSDSAVSLP